MHKVLLSLGSNKQWRGAGNCAMSPCQILCAAVEEMREYLTDVRCSSVYRTAAMYVTDQSDFLNMAVLGKSALTAHELLDAIHQTEASYGRDRGHEMRNGPRTLDIDIALFGSEVINDKDLVVPHPRMFERAFVLIPALEILDEKGDALRAKMQAALEKCKGQRAERVVP